MKFTERGDVVFGNRITREMQPTVKEHRTMAGREDETIAVQPTRCIGIKIHGFTKENRADFGAAERETKVSGVTGVDGVHGEATGFVCSGGKCFRVHKIRVTADLLGGGVRKP